MGFSATAYYAYDSAPQVNFKNGDPDLSTGPLVEKVEEEEEEEGLEKVLISGIKNLALPIPTTANEVAADLSQLTLRDRPVTFEELEKNRAVYEELASNFINMDS